MNLYSCRRWWLFLLFAPCVLMTCAVLLAWSVLGLFLLAPGVLGLSGIVGLLLGWIALIAPKFALRCRGLMSALLFMGLCAASFGVAIGASIMADALKSSHRWDWSYVVGLGGCSLGYAAIAGFFLLGFARTRPSVNEHAPLGVAACACASVIALGASILPLGVLLFVSGAPVMRALVKP